MSLWSLLLPFKWIIIGVGELFSGIFYLLKSIVSVIGAMIGYLCDGIVVVSRAITFFLKDIFIMSLVTGIKWLVSKAAIAIKLLFHGLKIVILGFFKVLKAIVLGFVNGIKFVLINTLTGVSVVIKSIIKFLGIIIKYLFVAIKYAFIYTFKGLKYIFKYLFIVIKTILTYLGKFLKLILLDFLYKYIAILLNGLLTILIKAIRGLSKIPLFIWKGIKLLGAGLYKLFIYPFVYLYKNFGRIILDFINKTKEQISKTIKAIISIPANIEKAIREWISNLSFVKDIRNRREMKRQTLLIDFDAEDAVRSEKKITYRYVAKNTEGKIEKGRLGAYSKLDVHSYLLAEGFEVYQITPIKGIEIQITSTTKIKVHELVFFLTQLSTYIKSGIPLVDSIKILGKQAKKTNTKSVYKSIIYDLTMGASFSEALEKQGSAFPKLLVNMIKSSELAGNLSETLDDMADYYTSVSATRKQMKSAMTYPSVIFVFAISVVVFLLTFVIPSFIGMYKDADAEVPALTTAIINLSDFLVNNYLIIILVAVFIVTGLYFMYKNVKVFRMLVQWLLMHMPVVGNIIIYNEVTMFSKTFASLWNHNVFITSSMEILTKITNNEIYKMLIFDAITNVARGEAVSTSFKNHWAFPVVAYEMLVTGERTGQPGPMMDKVATYYQGEHANSINQIKAFIEPVMIIFLAIVVGTILLAVVIPMFGIYGQLDLGQ